MPAGDRGVRFGNMSGDLHRAGLYADTIRRVKTVFADVAVTQGVAQTAALFTVPKNSLLLGVIARVTTAFDGATTQTLEVGITGNIDKYIDTTDFDPSAVAGTSTGSVGGTTNDQKTMEYITAAAALIATWTNTTSGTEGTVRVYAFYIDMDGE